MLALLRTAVTRGVGFFILTCLLGGVPLPALGGAPVLDMASTPGGDYCYIVTHEPGGLYRLSSSAFKNLGGTLSEDLLYALSLTPQGDLFLATFQEVLFSRSGKETSWRSLRGGGDLKNFYATRQGTFVALSWKKGLLWASRENPEFREPSGEMGEALVLQVLESPSGTLWAATFGEGVLLSRDGGRSWKPYNEGLQNHFVLSLTWDVSREVLYAGTYQGGVFRRSLHTPWESFSRGLPERAVVQALGLDDRGYLWGGTYGKGAFLASFGEAWRPFSKEPEDAALSINALEPFAGGMLGGTQERGLLFASPGASSWSSLEIADPLTGFGEISDGTLLALSRSGVLYEASRKEGPWKERGRIQGSRGCQELLVLSDRILLGGTSRGSWLSQDGGRSWVFRSFPVPDSSGEEVEMEFGPPSGEWGGLVGMVRLSSSVMAATSYKGLFRSSGGWGWKTEEEAREEIEGRYFYALASDGGSRIALGTDRGLSFSRDSGKSWINIYVAYGLSSVVFDDAGTLWGVSRNGIWRFVPPEMEPSLVKVEGYTWSPFAYFTELFPGEEGILLGLLQENLVRLLPEGKSTFSLEKSSLRNTVPRSYLRLSQGGMLLGTERGFYFSEEGGETWQERHVPRNLFNLSEGR